MLLFAPRAAVGGGVVNFTGVLERHLDRTFETEKFIIGQRAGLSGRFLRMIVPLYDALRLARVLSRRRHDIYHVNPSLVPRAIVRDGLYLLVLRAFRRRNVLVFIHGWNEECYRRIAESTPARFLFRLAYGRAARVLVLASSFAKKLEGLGLEPARIRVVTTMFEGAPLREAQRPRDDSEVRILFLARFVAEKGVYQLLEAFREVVARHPDALLTMAGDGPERQRAETWCATHGLADRVRFPGYVEGAAKARLLLESDIFALPSYHGEGCPVALLEAMGAGLPVIVTPVGGVPDIVEDGVNGIVLDNVDTRSIAEALLRLVRDRDMRAAMGRVNRDEAWRKYEAGQVTSNIAGEYLALAER